MRPTRESIAIIIALVSGLAACSATDTRLFKGDAQRYEAKYPATWLIWPDRKDLEIATYPVEKGLHGGLLPRGGAYIRISQNPVGIQATTVEDWIGQIITRLPDEVVSVRRTTYGERKCSELHIRTEVGPGVRYEEFSCFFEANGRLLSIDLEYHEGDAAANKHRAAYETVIRSFRSW